MATARINLGDFRSEDKVRRIKAKVFPADIYSINPSFFEELFFNVVTKLKKDAFLAKFKLEPKGEYDFQDELMEAIDRILNNATAIG